MSPDESRPADVAIGEPMPFRILLDEAWKQAKRHFRVLYWPIAVPLALVQVAIVVVNAESTRNVFTRLEQDPTAIFSLYLWLIPLILVSMLVFSVAYGVMGACATDAVAGRGLRLGERLRFTLRPRVLITLWSPGLVTLAGLAVCALFIALGVGGIIPLWAGGCLGAVGILLDLLLGIFVTLIWAFAMQVMVEERVFLGRALGRSRALAHYNPQRRLASSPMVKIFVLLIVGYLLSTAVSLVVQGPFLIAQQVMMFREVAAGGDPTAIMTDARLQLLQVPGAFLGSLAQTAVMIYLAYGVSLLYFDVRRRREAFDLESAIDALEAGRPAGEGR